MPPRPRGTAPSRPRPVRDANFQTKSQRKRVRKSMVRAYLANRVGEARVAARDRADFYRTLRLKKLRRREIAKSMRALAVSVAGVQQQARRVEDRNPHLDLKSLDEVFDLGRAAVGATEAAASEWELFSRRKIYYTEVVQ